MAATGENYPFDRPVIILAAPRSGSTLLFETLTSSADFWTIGGESHAVFENIRRFNPLSGLCDSNALTADDVTPENVATIRASFLSQLRSSRGERYSRDRAAVGPALRLLEKTPKNAVRVGMLNQVFPDALYIYLYRNPRENISSMIEAWRSGRFVTYRGLPGRHSPWSLLLPAGWQAYHDAPVEQIAAFQWRSANTAILEELEKLGPGRWIAVSYGQQVQHTAETVRRICNFCDVSATEILASLSREGMPLSRYTVTPPLPDKWQRNSAALSRVIPALADVVEHIREMAPDLPEAEFDLSLGAAVSETRPIDASQPPLKVGRNARCPCGSGKKFKHCHGALRSTGLAR